MRYRFLFTFCTIIFLFLFAGCSKTDSVSADPVIPPPQPEQSQPIEVPEQETEVPVVEITPIILPEPELQEPLWRGAPEISHIRNIQRTTDAVSIFETTPCDGLMLRLYQMENGDRVTMGRIHNSTGEISSYQWSTEQDGFLRWYDRSTGQWQEQPLAPGKVFTSMIELGLEDGRSFLIYPSKTYRLLENGVMEYLPNQDGSLNITKIGSNWQFTLLASLPGPDCVSDFTMVQGSRSMLNWEHHYCGELWKNYTMETEGKWCFDGYYWPCPDNYVPTGQNYLYACPAAYLIKSFAYAASAHPAAEDLALAMLDTMALQQNDQGYWPTSPRSDWLYADYGVDKEFYDTRFNTDLIEIYRVYYEYAGGDVLLEAMERYTDFFTDFAAQEHFTTVSGGWFIPDYTPASLQKPHSSLNHQVAECIELYQLSDILQRPELEELADRMLLAIEDTCSQWGNELGDLHYCAFPDGTFGMQDYPYLTYNDLFDLQKLLVERRGSQNEALQLLMNQKRQWMDSNGITGYSQ